MNASQRRKQKREFTHVITLIAKPGWRYFDHDEEVMTANNWCRWNMKDGFRVIRKYDHAQFQFATERDAVMFALKWL
jgi:hypothetical protein